MENREFKLHKDILWSIIQSQAGSLQKALLELVMNSIDAGATSVEITLTSKKFSIKDNGRGFVSRDEIEGFFETFGTPHQKGDATYGRFRMGRGQIMAFTRNRWRSGVFQMDVDIKETGLNYILKSDMPHAEGCAIEGTLYETLKPSELLVTNRALADLCQYTPIPVFLNGERITADMEAQKWTFSDEDAYYLLRSDSRQLVVYNLGVEVCKYPAENYGTGGVVVSRQQLEVNFARNDVLLSKCEVWKRAATKIRAHSRASESRKPQKNESYRSMMATQLMSGDFASAVEFGEVLSAEKLLTDVTGKHHTFNDVLNAAKYRFGGALAVAPSTTSRKADKLHVSNLCFVISPITFDRFEVSSLEEMFTAIENATISQGDRVVKADVLSTIKDLRAIFRDFDEVSALIHENHEPVPDNKLTPAERDVLEALREAQGRMMRHLKRVDFVRERRMLKVGTSDTAAAWTDGEKFISFERNQLKIAGFPGAALARFVTLGTLLLHEYVHADSDVNGHLHDHEFLEAYEKISCGTCVLGEFANDALNIWLKRVKNSEKTRARRGELKEMDRQAALGHAAD